MRWRTLYLGLSLVAAGCGDTTNHDGFVTRDLSAATIDGASMDLVPPTPTDDAMVTPTDDSLVTPTDDVLITPTDDSLTPTNDLLIPPTDDALITPTDDSLTPPADLTVPLNNPDLTVGPSPDLTGVKPPDLTGVPMPDLTPRPADMTGMKPLDMTAPPPDLAVRPADMTTVRDLATPPGPVKLAGGTLHLYGLTTDNFAVVGDAAKKQIAAYPLGGAAPTVILANATLTGAGAAIVRVRGRVAFVWSAPNASGVGPLLVWTSTTAPTTVAASSRAAVQAASADGNSILYTFASNALGTMVAIRGSSPTNTNARTYINSVGIPPTGDNTTCFPLLSVVGNRYGLVGYCTLLSGAATVTSIDFTNQKQVDMITNANDFYSVDAAGANVFLNDGANANTDGTGNAIVVPIMTVVTANTPKVDGNVYDGFLSADGSTIIYQYNGAHVGLRRSAVKNPAPMTLLTQGVNGFVLAARALSPDEKWVVYSSNLDMVSQFPDLSLASTTTANTRVTLNNVTTSTDVSASLYTADSSHVFFGVGMKNVVLGNGATTTTGTLVTRGTNNGNPTNQTTTVWDVIPRNNGTSKIAYSDNLNPAGGGTADIRAVDTAGGPSTLIATQADLGFRVTFAGDRAVYTLSSGNTGLYVNTLP